MSYQVLARKWRPKNFQELVGQAHVSQALRNALDQNRLHHAYLFTGTRGVGKTTIARILAKSLNCETGITANPCGKCEACRAIDEGRFIDLIEIDAASRTKVEDTREILDNVQYTPSSGRYKVYLIDEIHMLSGHSFNALLKTLEEPPPHVVFLLATTDPQKLPATVLSRCLQFYLKNLPSEQIKQHLAFILEKEDIRFDNDALKLLARAAKGSVRDALSLTDQAIAFCQNKITAADVRTMLGHLEQDALFPLIDALNQQDAPALLSHIHTLASSGVDFSSALDEMITTLQYIAIAQAVPDALPPLLEGIDQIKHYANTLTAEDVQLYYQIALIGRRDLALSPEPQGGFEMIMLRMLAFSPTTPATTKQIHRPRAQTNPTAAEQKPTMPIKKPTAQQPVKSTAPTKNSPGLPSNWPDIMNAIALSGMALELASHCSAKEISAQKIDLLIAKENALLLNQKHRQRIQEAINNHFNTSMQVTINIGKVAEQTPAQQSAQCALEKQTAAVAAIENDPTARQLIDTFDATLMPEMVRPNNEKG
jgi:DNA polymerase III subunit gamma/tau